MLFQKKGQLDLAFRMTERVLRSFSDVHWLDSVAVGGRHVKDMT
jgi:hypothetical protein